MAPVRPPPSGSQKITSFFSSSSAFTIPRERRPAPESIGDEIVVAAAPSSSATTSTRLRNVVNPVNGAADVTPPKDSPYHDPAPDFQTTTTSTSSSSLSTTMPTASSSSLSTTMPSTSSSSLSTSVGSSAASATALRSSTNSRRIVKDGLKAIANSDSDMSDDSSVEELADPSSFFAKKRKLSPEPVRTAIASRSTRSSDAIRQSNLLDSMTKSPPKRTYQYSLASLSREGQKMKQARANIASMQQAVEESKKREEEAARQEALGLNIEIDNGAFLEWASDDEEGDRRLKALQRVEALHTTDNYYFFLDEEPLFHDSPFPVNSLPDEPWSKLYATDISREQACVSGLAAEMALHFPLPMAITNWMAQQLLHEQNDALCEAYVAILEASSRHNESLSDTIASLSSMYKTRSLFENNWKAPGRRGLPAGLKYILQVVQSRAPAADNVAPDAAPVKTIEAFLDLAMMNLDEMVRKDLNLSLTLSKCIEDLLDSLSDTSFEKLVPGVLEVLDDSETDLPALLRCRLIAALPGRTMRSYQLRRRLALDILLPRDERTKAASSDWNWLETISKTLQSRNEFDVRDTTDYDLLMALLEVADIAASVGFTDYTELHPPPGAIEKRVMGLYAAPSPLSQAAKTHNHHIDAIVSELEFIKSRIQHESTSLCRQEVKATLERVIARLETSVRTRPKPKKQVFGAEPKQAHFARETLKIVRDALDEPSAEQMESIESPATPSIGDDLPCRPGIDDVESNTRNGDLQLLTPASDGSI